MTWRIGLAAAGAAVLAVSACGRLGFDAAPDADGVTTCHGTGHDEDGDTYPDSCDPCPHLAGTLADMDGDGVGDACDPEPETPRQSIAEFAAFDVLPDAWFANGGAEITNDQFQFEGRDGAVTAFRPWARGTSTFVVGYHTGTPLPDVTRIFAIMTEDTTAARRDLYCETIENDTNTRVQLTYTHDGSGFPHIDTQFSPVGIADHSGTMAFTTGLDLHCDVALDTLAEHSAGADISDVLADRLVLYVQSVPVAFDWMIEIRTAD